MGFYIILFYFLLIPLKNNVAPPPPPPSPPLHARFLILKIQCFFFKKENEPCQKLVGVGKTCSPPGAYSHHINR